MVIEKDLKSDLYVMIRKSCKRYKLQHLHLDLRCVSRTSIVLSKIKSTIRQIDPEAEVILYGSRASGDERPDSDRDLLILVNTKADLDYESVFRHRLFDLELELEQSFSVTVHNKNQWRLKHWVTPLYQNITREGIRI